MKTIVSTLLSTTAGMMSYGLSYARGAVVHAFSSPSPMLLSHVQRQRKLFSSSAWETGNVDIDGRHASFERNVNSSTNRTALIFDTETTGMVRFRDPYTDESQPELIQLGFLLVDTNDWKVRNQGSFLVKLRDEEIQIDKGAQRVHGISKEDCSCFGIEHETALGIFENLCRAADVIVAHNIRFDSIVMNTAFHRGRCSNAGASNDSGPPVASRTQSFSKLFSSKRHICTMMESIDVCKLPSKFSKSKKKPSYKWPSLAEAYNFVTNGQEGELKNAHDALADSEACLKVFRYLVDHGHISMEQTGIAVETEEADSEDLAMGITCDEHSAPGILNPPAAMSKDPLFSSVESTHDDSNDDERDNCSAEQNGANDQSIEVEKMAANPAEQSGNRSDFATHRDTNTISADNHVRSRNTRSVIKATGKGFRVRGNTYPHKELIKKLGGRWDGKSKEWVFRDDKNVSKLESYHDLEIVFTSKK